jgi:hypothetical protein
LHGFAIIGFAATAIASGSRPTRFLRIPSAGSTKAALPDIGAKFPDAASCFPVPAQKFPAQRVGNLLIKLLILRAFLRGLLRKMDEIPCIFPA